MIPVGRPATAADVAQFHPGGLAFTVRGVAFDLDGETVGMGGIAYRPEPVGPYFFAETTPAFERFPRVMIRAARAFLASVNLPVAAFADPRRPMSEKLLVHLGFTFMGRSPDGIAAFRWGGCA